MTDRDFNKELSICRYNIETAADLREGELALSFSGGKDSTVVHDMLDRFCPGNEIPRVYFLTPMEMRFIWAFVRELGKTDNRIEIVSVKGNPEKVLPEIGYPFYSKDFSAKMNQIRTSGWSESLRRWMDTPWNMQTRFFACPPQLREIAEHGLDIPISDKCCEYYKESPAREWQKKHGIPYMMDGLRRGEGGRRSRIGCVSLSTKKYHPLALTSDAFIDEYVKRFNVGLAAAYDDYYGWKRTGCAGCPFGSDVLSELKRLPDTDLKKAIRYFLPVYRVMKDLKMNGFAKWED